MIHNKLEAVELKPQLFKSAYSNGLSAVVKETPGTKVVTVQIWVKAGSVYEEPREAGITHLIEHMIFKGTKTRGPGDLAGVIEGLGGRVNAYTSYEYTVYHATLSARHWRMALEMLADAVQNSVFDPTELEREKKVVLEEVGMRNDRPDIMLFQEMMATAYGIHPYRRPVIGTVETISSFTRDDILSYMGKHYHPENLTVVIAGDVQGPEVLAEVRKLMGAIEQGGQAVLSPLPQEPAQENLRLFTRREQINQPHLALAFAASKFDSPDTPVLDVLSQIVGQGESSRLYRVLRDEKGLVFGITGSAFTPRDPGLFEITAVLDGEKLLPALEAALIEVFRLKHLPVTDQELQRAKLILESDFIFNLERVEGQARVMGSFEQLTGDPREDDYLADIRAVSVEDIKRVARKYFSAEQLTVGFLVSRDSDFSVDKEQIKEIVGRAELEARETQGVELLADAYLDNVYRFTLTNGMRLLVREDLTVPTVAVRAVFPGGLRAETSATNGVFSFISEILPKGTEKMSAQEIAVAVADMGGTLTAFSGKNTFGIKGDFLSRFLKPGMELIRDTIRTPGFSEDEAEKIRFELLAQLKQQEDSLTSVAIKEFNRLLFDGHPYGLNTIGSEEVLRSYTASALKEVFQHHARPDELVLAVSGAVDAMGVYTLVQSLFGDWKTAPQFSGSDITEELLPPSPPSSPRVFSLSRQKEQVHLVVGFVGTTIAAEDRYSLEVLDTVLSGQSGRLFTELRDRQSLAYSLSSFTLFGLDTGAFGIYMGTSPDKKDQALAGIWQELQRVRQDVVSEEELIRAKNSLIGQYELSLQTHGSQALEMGLNETYGLGQDFGNRYIKAINSVDAEGVLAAAQKYILPNNYVLVSVGAEPQNKQE